MISSFTIIVNQLKWAVASRLLTYSASAAIDPLEGWCFVVNKNINSDAVAHLEVLIFVLFYKGNFSALYTRMVNVTSQNLQLGIG